jgi:DNA-binding MarR family transcriptional regulator
MAKSPYSGPEDCNCLAVRQAARHITQFYDQFLAPSGLRTTQFSILAKLRRLGPMTINALAAAMVMDRTTLGRNVLPLERDGLIAVEQGSRDRRSKELRVTEAGEARFRAGKRLGASAAAVRKVVRREAHCRHARPPARGRCDQAWNACRNCREITQSSRGLLTDRGRSPPGDDRGARSSQLRVISGCAGPSAARQVNLKKRTPRTRSSRPKAP